MQTFEEWLKANHEEIYDENWKNLVKAGALGAALCTGIGCSQSTNPNAIPSSSHTSPNAAQFLDDAPSDSWTAPGAEKFLPNTQNPTQHKGMFAQHHQRMEKSRQKMADLNNYKNQLNNAGQQSGIFVDGQLVNRLKNGQIGQKVTITGNGKFSLEKVIGPNADPAINMD